jgi:hypothetical protein
VCYLILFQLDWCQFIFRDCDFSYTVNHIGGVMVSVLALGAVDRGFDPRSGHTRDYEIGICCFSAKHAVLRKIE